MRERSMSRLVANQKYILTLCNYRRVQIRAIIPSWLTRLLSICTSMISMMNSAFTLLHKSTANTLYRCIDFLEARGRPGNHSNNYWLLKARDRFPDESEWWLFYREPTTCRVLLSSSLHASPLVFPVELATESVNLESSCGLEILIIRALLQVVSQLPEQLIRYLYNLSGNRVQLRWWRVHKRIWSAIEKYRSKSLILHTRLEANIVQHDWASLLLFLCYVYLLCQTRQCISSIFGRERYFGTCSSPSQWKLRYYSRFRKSVSKSIHLVISIIVIARANSRNLIATRWPLSYMEPRHGGVLEPDGDVPGLPKRSKRLDSGARITWPFVKLQKPCLELMAKPISKIPRIRG